MKKISLILLTVILILSQFTVFASVLSEDVELEVRKEYESNAEFIKDKQRLGDEWAEDLIQEITEMRINKLTKNSRRGETDAIQQVSIKVIEQPNEYSCGPTAVLNVLYTAGRASYVSGTTDNAKITTLSGSAYCNTTENSGTSPDRLSLAINAFMTTANKNYKYSSIYSSTDMNTYLHSSLQKGYAPIIHVNQSKLSYWDGYGGGHYLSVYYINLQDNVMKVGVSDSYNGYYCSHSPYLNTFGLHILTIKELFNAANGKSVTYYQ